MVKQHRSIVLSVLTLSGFLAALAVLSPTLVQAQTVAGTISSPAGSYWHRIAHYKAGHKLFIADKENAKILVYDSDSLAYITEIPLSFYFPGFIMDMAFHEGTGTIYAIGTDFPDDDVVTFIDADTYQVLGTNQTLGYSAKLGVDEDRDRLYVFGSAFAGKVLSAIDVNTNTVVGSLNIETLMGVYSNVAFGQRHINPVTGELFLNNMNYNMFVVVDGPAMTGVKIEAANCQGWEGTWNPQENKIYITRAAWNGYFIYDRDTGGSTVAASSNDGTQLFYSGETNRVYSGAEINGDSTVIEGATDAWQNVEIASGHAEVAFMNHSRRAYFANHDSVVILDEDSLTPVTTIAACQPGAYGIVNTEITIDQAKGRTYILNYWSSPSEASCVFVIDEPPPITQEDLLATWDGQGVYYRNSDTGAWVKLASPATMLTCGDLDEDGIDDLIGLWPSQGGIWIRYSQSGSWARLSSTAVHIASGDMNGDGRDDLLGTWDGQGVYYRDSETGAWVKMASPASMITTGDLDGDETDDLIGIWPSQGGVWVKYSQSGTWARLSSTALDIAAGDMNGDGRDDLLATWTGQGVFFRDSMTGAWVKMASEADQITCGDLDADGTADLIGIWPSQGGVWVKYSDTGTWARISSTAQDISAGVMRQAGGEILSPDAPLELALPLGGLADGPYLGSITGDFSDATLDEPRLASRDQKNLIPGGKTLATRRHIPGPGEPGFKAVRQANLVPREGSPSKSEKPIREQEKKRQKRT